MTDSITLAHDQASLDAAQKDTLSQGSEIQKDPVQGSMSVTTTEDGIEEKLADRPEWLPANFKTVEDFVKASQETKAELTRLQQNSKQQPQEQAEAPPSGTNEAQKEVEAKGLDWNALTEEYATNRGLSEDTYKMLEEKGIPKAAADSYIKGAELRTEQFKSSLIEAAGSEEGFNNVLNWAAENLSAREIEAYNRALAEDPDLATTMFYGIHSKYTRANGVDPKLISGKSNPSTQTHTGDYYKSSFEMTKAMEDPRYWKDPDYQKEVKTKTQVSIAKGLI